MSTLSPFVIRLDEQTREWLKSRSETMERPVSEIIRRILNAERKRYDKRTTTFPET